MKIVQKSVDNPPDKYKVHRTDKEFLDICDKIRNSFDRCITEDYEIDLTMIQY